MPAPSPTHRAALVWEWVQAALLSLNLAWTTLCLGGFRAETMVVTSALTGALIACHLLARALVASPRLHVAGWLLLPFVIYAAINAQWLTPVHWLGWRDWFGWAQMIAVFWVVLNGVRSPAPRRALFGVLIALGVIAVTLACYQRFVQPNWLMLGRVQASQYLPRASGCFGIPNSLAAFLLLLIPPLGVLAFRAEASARVRLLCGVGCALLAYGVVLTISRGAWIGLGLALAAWPLLGSRVAWRKRMLASLAALVALAALAGGLFVGSSSVHERLVALVRNHGETTRPILWRAAWRIFREHPAVGGGAGSFNTLFEKYRPEGFRDNPQWAHNDYLNTLGDYGFVGFALLFGAVGVIAWRGACNRPATDGNATNGIASRPTRAAFVIGLLAFAFQLFVDFHFKIPALAMAFAVIAALAIGSDPRSTERDSPPLASRLLGGILAAVFIFGIWRFILPAYEAEALRYNARQRIDGLAGMSVDAPDYRERLEQSRGELARAVMLDPANAQAWADSAYVASLRGHILPTEVPTLGGEAETTANRALVLSPQCAEFWVRRGVARDMQGRWFEGSTDFVRATTLAPAAAWAWFYYADHLSRKANETGLTEAALALCLRLDPQNQDALALRQRLAISRQAAP